MQSRNGFRLARRPGRRSSCSKVWPGYDRHVPASRQDGPGGWRSGPACVVSESQRIAAMTSAIFCVAVSLASGPQAVDRDRGGDGPEGIRRGRRPGGRRPARPAVRRRVRRRGQRLPLRHLQPSHPQDRRAGPGSITTVAGSGTTGFSGDGGPATEAQLNEPYGVVLDAAGNLFFADRLNRRVRRVDARTGRDHDGRGQRLEGLLGRRRAGRRRPGWSSPTASPSTRTGGRSSSPTWPATGSASSTSPRGRSATFAGTGSGRHDGDGGPAATALDLGCPRRRGRARRDGLHPRARGQHAPGGRPADRPDHDHRRHRRQGILGRRRPRHGGDLQRAQGAGRRPSGQPLHRRHREPRDPGHRSRARGRSAPWPARAKPAARATAGRRPRARLDRPHGVAVGPDGGSGSATPTTTGSACVSRRHPELGIGSQNPRTVATIGRPDSNSSRADPRAHRHP